MTTRSARLLDAWPADLTLALELRHESWLDDEVHDRLRDSRRRAGHHRHRRAGRIRPSSGASDRCCTSACGARPIPRPTSTTGPPDWRHSWTMAWMSACSCVTTPTGRTAVAAESLLGRRASTPDGDAWHGRGDHRPGPAQALRRHPGRGRCLLRGGPGRGVRDARAQRGGQDHDRRDPGRPAGARQRQCAGPGSGRGERGAAAQGAHRRPAPDRGDVPQPDGHRDHRPVPQLLPPLPDDRRPHRGAGPGRAAGRPDQGPLGRPATAAVGGPRARERARGAVPRRADDRPRSAGTPVAVGPGAVAQGRRHDGPADDPLHGGSRAAVRPAGHHGSRQGPGAGHGGAAGRRAVPGAVGPLRCAAGARRRPTRRPCRACRG